MFHSEDAKFGIWVAAIQRDDTESRNVYVQWFYNFFIHSLITFRRNNICFYTLTYIAAVNYILHR